MELRCPLLHFERLCSGGGCCRMLVKVRGQLEMQIFPSFSCFRTGCTQCRQNSWLVPFQTYGTFPVNFKIQQRLSKFNCIILLVTMNWPENYMFLCIRLLFMLEMAGLELLTYARVSVGYRYALTPDFCSSDFIYYYYFCIVKWIFEDFCVCLISFF